MYPLIQWPAHLKPLPGPVGPVTDPMPLYRYRGTCLTVNYASWYGSAWVCRYPRNKNRVAKRASLALPLPIFSSLLFRRLQSAMYYTRGMGERQIF